MHIAVLSSNKWYIGLPTKIEPWSQHLCYTMQLFHHDPPVEAFCILHKGIFMTLAGNLYDPNSLKSLFSWQFGSKEMALTWTTIWDIFISQTIHGKMKIYRYLYLFDPRVPYVAHVDQEIYPPKKEHTPPERPVPNYLTWMAWLLVFRGYPRYQHIATTNLSSRLGSNAATEPGKTPVISSGLLFSFFQTLMRSFLGKFGRKLRPHSPTGSKKKLNSKVCENKSHQHVLLAWFLHTSISTSTWAVSFWSSRLISNDSMSQRTMQHLACVHVCFLSDMFRKPCEVKRKGLQEKLPWWSVSYVFV